MKYVSAFDIAAMAHNEACDIGLRFRYGVVRAAALAAAKVDQQLDARNAMCRVFEAYLLPPSRGDGSMV